MVCSETCESSSCVTTSSSPPRMKRSDWSRWLSVTKAVSAQPERILASSCSSPNSPLATALTSLMKSACESTPKRSSCSIVKACPGKKGCSSLSKILRQCRSPSASLPRSVMTPMASLKSSTLSLNMPTTASVGSRLAILCTSLKYCCTSLTISSTSSSRKGSDFHWNCASFHVLSFVQISCLSSYCEIVSRSCVNSCGARWKVSCMFLYPSACSDMASSEARTSPSRSSTTLGSQTGSTNSPVCSVVNWTMRSSLSFVIDLSSDAVIAGMRCSTAPLASSTLAEKASRASLRSSFLTASCEGILTSYLSRRSYISLTCAPRSSMSRDSSKMVLTLSQYSAKSRSERGCSPRSRMRCWYSCSEATQRSRATCSSKPRHLSSERTVIGVSRCLSVFESTYKLRSVPESFMRSRSLNHLLSCAISCLKLTTAALKVAVCCDCA